MLTHRSGMFWWPSQTGSSTALSGSCSADRSPHLSEKHPFLVAVGLLPALPHLLIPLSPTNTIRFGIFLFDCLKKKKCSGIVGGEFSCFIVFLGDGKLFHDADDLTTGILPGKSPRLSTFSLLCVGACCVWKLRWFVPPGC